MILRARTLTAAATATVLLGVVVPAGAATAAPDTEPPVGSFVILSASSSDDPGPMRVEVAQSSLRDDVTPRRDLVREVNWGTGVGFEAWVGGRSVAFDYTSVGRYHLRVRVRDAAGNTTVEDLGTIVVTDAFEPRLLVNKPATDRLPAWRSLRGYARDVGLAGLDFVRVKAVQKRGRGWFAYRGPGRDWRPAATRLAARRVARPVRVPADANGAWRADLDGVTAGLLVLRTVARDHAGNRSRPVVVARDLVG